MTRYPGLTLRVFGKGEPAIGPGKAELVARIRESGSISAAAREMGMSYRRAWMLVAALNASFKAPLVVAETGGRRGGGARVTGFGERVVAEYHAMEDEAAAAIAPDLKSFARHLKTGGARRSRGK